jgi:hypothetical protein
LASRRLTEGEVAMASALFGAAIDSARVRILHAQYLFMHEMVKRDRLHTVASKFNYETALGHRKAVISS